MLHHILTDPWRPTYSHLFPPKQSTIQARSNPTPPMALPRTRSCLETLSISGELTPVLYSARQRHAAGAQLFSRILDANGRCQYPHELPSCTDLQPVLPQYQQQREKRGGIQDWRMMDSDVFRHIVASDLEGCAASAARTRLVSRTTRVGLEVTDV